MNNLQQKGGNHKLLGEIVYLSAKPYPEMLAGTAVTGISCVVCFVLCVLCCTLCVVRCAFFDNTHYTLPKTHDSSDTKRYMKYFLHKIKTPSKKTSFHFEGVSQDKLLHSLLKRAVTCSTNR